MRSLTVLPLVLTLALGAAPARAETAEDLKRELGDAMRQLFEEMKPALDDAFKMLEGFESLGGLDDPRHYQMPEILPNGDIIIRRRDDAPAFRGPEPDAPTTDGTTIDL